MTRVVRTRSRNLYVSGVGSVTRTVINDPSAPPVVSTFGPINLGDQVTTDHVGQVWVDSPFDMKEARCPRITLNGVRTATGLRFESVGVPLLLGPTERFSKPWVSFGKPMIPSSTLAAMAIANMNPNRPDRDIVTSLVELHELPRLLLDSVKILRKRGGKPPPPSRNASKANLMAQFGLLPIIQDLVYLFNFASVVDKREKYLRELSTGFRRIKRRLTVETWDDAVYDLGAFPSTADNQSVSNKIHIYCHATRTYWYTARARLTNPPPDREVRYLAEQLSSGMSTINVEQLWNLVPWTWLIDWFTDTGLILGAFRQGVPWQYEGLNVMCKTEYHVTSLFPSKRAGFTYSPSAPSSRGITKVRLQPTVSIYPKWYTPYLTASQWSILASLTLLRL